MFKLKENEVNTGRQKEIDIVKGFLMILIIFIHSFQTIADENARVSGVYRGLFSVFMLSGACLYLFSMGFGSVYSKHNSPKELAKSGIRLLFYQALSNLIYGVCLTIPYYIRNLLMGEAIGSRDLYEANLIAMLTFLNIFYISGMAYFLLALLKKINVPVSIYFVLSIVFAFLSPILAKLTSENPIVYWLLEISFGGQYKTSFSFFPYLSFVLMGYVFAKILRRVEEKDKGRFYMIFGSSGLIIMGIWLIISIIKYPSIDEMYGYLRVMYHIPGLLKLLVSTCTIVGICGIAYFLLPAIKKLPFVYDKLISYSTNISKLYAVHIGVYMVIEAAFAFLGFSTKACLLWSVVVLIVTDIIVCIYNKIYKKLSLKKKIQK